MIYRRADLHRDIIGVCQVGMHDELWAVGLDDCGRALRAEDM